LVDSTDDVLVFEAISSARPSHPWALDEGAAAALGDLYRSGKEGSAGPAHGDFAPWNLLSTGPGVWTLIDWEHAEDRRPPFYDLWHWLVQCHTLLHTVSADELMAAGNSSQSWIAGAFESYAGAAGLDVKEARSNLAAYLHLSRANLKDQSHVGLAALTAREELSRAVEE
jgi:hypothetical protein